MLSAAIRQVYTEIYEKFTTLFNERVEAFIVKNGSTLEKFVAECENAKEDSFALELIMGITSFDAFKQLMIDTRASRKL